MLSSPEIVNDNIPEFHKIMNIEIQFDSPSDKTSYELVLLRELLQSESNFTISSKVENRARIKDGITTMLEIAGLTLTSISTLISLLTYWQAQKTSYSIKIQKGSSEWVIQNISKNELNEMLSKDEPIPLKVLISNNG